MSELEPLPDGVTASRIVGQRGYLYEFDVDNVEPNVQQVLQEADLGGMSVAGGQYVQVQSWDRDQVLAAYKAVAAAGYTIVP